MLAIGFAACTALVNAFAVTSQHIASFSARDQISLKQTIGRIVRHPLWLLGWIGLIGSLVSQSLALHFGPISTVQPVLMSELVFALILRRLWLRQSISRITWLSASVSAVSLALFIVATSPRSAVHPPTSTQWEVSVAMISVGIGSLVATSVGRTPAVKACLLAIATSLSWALEATFIKAATNVLTTHGWSGLAKSWTLYAFMAGGLAGLLLEQSALHVGPLRNSLPFIVTIDPIVSIALGLGLYSERFVASPAVIAGGLLALILACGATIVLVRTSPEETLRIT